MVVSRNIPDHILKRVQFFQRLAKGESVKNIVEDLLHVPLWRKNTKSIKELCRRIIPKKADM